MNTYKITTNTGNHWITGFNGDMVEAMNYYLGTWFNLGTVEDKMEQAIRVERIGE